MPLATRNRRSFVALDNLVDLVACGLTHFAAANQTFLVSDGEDLSTTELLRRAAAALRRPGRLVRVPSLPLWAAARPLGKRDLVSRLLGSLRVDMGKARELLGWAPRVGVDEALAITAHHDLEHDAN